jgi:hypothetical protein
MKCALPDHLKEKKHDDWPFFLRWIPRSANVKGPRCGKGSPGYLPWPPLLIEGKGVSRWETDGATSIIEIPDLANRTVKGSDVYGQTFSVIERKGGHPQYGQVRDITLSWVEGMEIEGQYSPSAVQKFSREGWMKLDPGYSCGWRQLKKGKEEPVLFWRYGWRPDHLDIYYNFGPFAGLKYE